ncbi:MAG: hypothetical protein KZQ58_01155 [gamma proteobacterium symbiont of Bathyaustriella thionipta]|nr:hypothetical protein [gamma proteobacterium symbiont of Bathyaustriella thionipta]
MTDAMAMLYRSAGALGTLMLLLVAVAAFNSPLTPALFIALAWFFLAAGLLVLSRWRPDLLVRARMPLLLLDVSAVAAVMYLGGAISSILFMFFPLYSLHVRQHFKADQRFVSILF